MDGRVKKGTQIRMMATGFTTEVVEVGYFGAGQFIPCDELTAGMVGYITASIKNLGDTRVGDTVTDNERPCAERSMVISVMRWRSFSSMMHHCFLSLRHLLLLDLVSAVVSLGCFILKSFRNVLRENTILTL